MHAPSRSCLKDICINIVFHPINAMLCLHIESFTYFRFGFESNASHLRSLFILWVHYKSWMPLRFLSVFLHHFYYSYTLILHFLVSIAVFFSFAVCVCVCVCNSTPIFLPTIQTRSMSLWVFTTLCRCIRLHLWYGKWKMENETACNRIFVYLMCMRWLHFKISTKRKKNLANTISSENISSSLRSRFRFVSNSLFPLPRLPLLPLFFLFRFFFILFSSNLLHYLFQPLTPCRQEGNERDR